MKFLLTYKNYARFAAVSAAAFALIMAFAGCGGEPDKGDSVIKRTVYEDGGTVEGPYGFALIIPPGRLKTPCDVSLAFSNDYPKKGAAMKPRSVTARVFLSCSPVIEGAILQFPLAEQCGAGECKGAGLIDGAGDYEDFALNLPLDGFGQFTIISTGYYLVVEK